MNNNNDTIIDCKITAMPKDIFDKMPEIHVTYSNGQGEILFSYYPDEISFDENEFIGLTRNEALELRHKKDKAYLQS